jgi:retron-type reverse transcriptase
MSQTKPIEISKYEVEEAYKRVKANKGSAGIDHQSLQDFDQDKSNNLYKLWNRMSSGSYMPPPVLRVEIPKGDGGIRKLGIPTISDRIAQMVVKQRIEPELEQHPDTVPKAMPFPFSLTTKALYFSCRGRFVTSSF